MLPAVQLPAKTGIFSFAFHFSHSERSKQIFLRVGGMLGIEDFFHIGNALRFSPSLVNRAPVRHIYYENQEHIVLDVAHNPVIANAIAP